MKDGLGEKMYAHITHSLRRVTRARIQKASLNIGHKTLVLIIGFTIIFGDLTGLITPLVPKFAEAAQVTIDATVNTASASHLHAGPQTVFTSDTTGYKFYRDASGECVYAKTANSGGTWSAPVLVDDRGASVDCVAISVWYDQWTPNATSGQQYIHVTTMSTSGNGGGVFYNRVDTANSDALLTGSTAISASTSTGQTSSFVAGANYPAITKGTDGTVYIAADDTSDSFVVKCDTSSNCATTGGWSEAGSRPQDLANDYSILVPLINGEIMIINRDISLEDIRSKIWNGTAWSGSWTFIDSNATDNTTYDIGLAAVVASSTVVATTTTYLAYTADNATLGTDDDIRTGRYQNGIWATSTTAGVTKTAQVLTNDAKGVTNIAIGLDKNTQNVYVAYNARTTPATATTGNTYWKMSTTSMSSWSAEVGPINTAANNFYGVDLDLVSDQRMYVSWNDAAADDIYGDTIADLVPGVTVSTSSSQTTEVTASTTGFYIGSPFVFNESVAIRDVTGITIEEDGSIDAQNALKNIVLKYENDTTFPYDCSSESYSGSESQFGSTDTDGFSGANGSSTFIGSASVSTTSALCVYPIMDVIDSAANNDTIHIFMGPPSARVSVSLGGEVAPTTTLSMAGSTTVRNDILTQTQFHWRNDDGSEAAATSRTGGVEGANISAIQQDTPVRLRLGVNNAGGTTSPAIFYRLEYSPATSTCQEAYQWTDVGSTDDDWNMFDSSFLTDGDDTTNIVIASGGVTDAGLNFVTPNGAVKDTSSQTAGIIATSTQFIELEYSVVASTSAPEGLSYCFRVTDKGDPLPVYSLYPRATIAADVSVTATSSQTATADVPTSDFYIGGAYVITENSSSRNVTSITLAEDGSVDAASGLSNIKLKYDLDTTAPYDCLSESYGGSESQFGSTDTDGFSSANGTSTFTGSVAISTTSTMCLYPVVDITESALNDETLNIVISSPGSDVLVTGGGSVSPTITRDITGSTTLRAAILTQMRYHWRNDTGIEASSTSRTGGVEGTVVPSLYDATPVRLRVEVSNEGVTTTPATRFRLEYGNKITTCSAVASWTDVGATLGAWDMYDSPNLTNGGDTTDIAIGLGGVTNENSVFKSPNGGVLDTTSLSASTTLSETQFIELEYSIEQTVDAGYSSPYCFRVTKNGVPLEGGYTLYPELTTAPERDFKVQHGTSTITGTSLTIVAGVDYIAPAASTSAFIRITNAHYTGAGSTAGGTQNADDVTAYIQNPSNITTSITFSRAFTATGNTRISWEIVEFVGKPGSDNEMVVRQQEAVTYGPTNTFATGTPVSTVASSSKVVVFITGQLDPDTAATNYNSGQSTASWDMNASSSIFQRGDAGNDASIISYAIVEFIGQNWNVQRVSHTYTAAGAVETENITAVNSLARTFIHPQKRMNTGLNGNDEYGHEVWLSSVGAISFQLQSGATTPSGQTSVVWVVENTQTSTGAAVVTRSNGTISGGTAPLTGYINIGATIGDVENTSIFLNTRSSLTTTVFPRPMLGVLISTSTTNYQYWRSNIGSTLTYRTEVVEWPVAGTSLRQNDYRFYVHNNALHPTDPWPVGVSDLGEDTSITASDTPPGSGAQVRIRMSVAVINSSLPESSQAFILQYAPRVTSCSAVSAGDWFDLGDAASTTPWRGYNASGTTDGTALSTDPPTGGDLNLTVSDVAGTVEEENTSVLNPYRVEENQDVEYDWIVEQNDAPGDTVYCFRMVKSDGSALDGYFNYPQIRTAPFTPLSQNWRWYDDEGSATPVIALAAENTAPINIANGNTLRLRMTAHETKNITQPNARFKLQFSEFSTFSTSSDVVATTSCTGSSLWCYANGAGTDNAVIPSGVLSDSDSCSGGVGDGCGTYVESSTTYTGFTHPKSGATEYDFTIAAAGPRVNRTYFFRMYDLVNDVAVPLNTGESYPSLTTEGASLTFSTTGIGTSTVTEGVTTDVASTPTNISYGALPIGTQLEAAQRFSVTTNATEGYKMLMYSTSNFLSAGGDFIPPVNASNTAPLAWSTGCGATASGCYGYHVGDDTLEGGSTRFAPVDTYAGFETTAREVGYSSVPVTGDSVDIIYRVLAQQGQAAGQYSTDITFVTLPSF